MSKDNNEFVVDFADASSGGMLKDMTPDDAAQVRKWLMPKRLNNKKGQPYDVGGLPVIAEIHAKQLKATCKAKGWCEAKTKLSSYAWDGNKQDYKVDIWNELLELMGIDNTVVEEESQADV